MTIAKRIKKAAFPSPPPPPPPPPLVRRLAQAQRGGGKRLNSTNCGALRTAKSATFGAGWPPNGPGGTSWAGPSAAGARRLCVASGNPCRYITTATVGSLPTNGKPTPRCCPAGSTGPVPKVRSGPVPSRLLIILCASPAACWCARPAHPANPWPCTRPGPKLYLMITILPCR